MNIDHEREIIATAIDHGISPDIGDALDSLNEQMFQDAGMRKIYLLIQMMRKQSLPIDISTVSDRLREPEGISKLSILISQSVCNPNSIGALSDSLHRDWCNAYIKSELAQICAAIDNSAEKIPVDDLQNRMRSVFETCEKKQPRTPERMADMLPDYIDIMQDRIEGNATARGLDIGLDMPINRTDLLIIGGTPGMGKTALAMFIVGFVAENGGTCLVYSLEMEKIQLLEREVSRHSKITSEALRDPINSEVDFAMVTAAAAKIQSQNVWVNDTPSLSVNTLESSARRFKQQHPDVALVVVDYLTLMQTPKAERRDLSIGEITRRCKLLAKELEVPIVMLSQLNRNAPNQKREPMISDLRDSGSIEQDADKIIFPYRDDTNPGLAKVLKRKVRDGKPGDLTLEFINGNFYSTGRTWMQPAEPEKRTRKPFREHWND